MGSLQRDQSVKGTSRLDHALFMVCSRFVWWIKLSECSVDCLSFSRPIQAFSTTVLDCKDQGSVWTTGVGAFAHAEGAYIVVGRQILHVF